MKIRKGFVSNSSSASFIISRNVYKNLFEAVKAFLVYVNNTEIVSLFGDDDRLIYTTYAFFDGIEEYAFLEYAINNKIDPNTPLLLSGNAGNYFMEYKDKYAAIIDWEYETHNIEGFEFAEGEEEKNIYKLEVDRRIGVEYEVRRLKEKEEIDIVKDFKSFLLQNGHYNKYNLVYVKSTRWPDTVSIGVSPDLSYYISKHAILNDKDIDWDYKGPQEFWIAKLPKGDFKFKLKHK